MSKVKDKNKITDSKKETKDKKAREDIKSPRIKAVEHDQQWGIFHDIAFWGLAVLLFLPPYFRGLFFAPEQERALIFAAVLFWFAWLWKWSKRDNSFTSHPMDYFVLAFPLVYLISAFQAANQGLAVDEVVKTTLYFMVYWLSSRLVRNENDIVTILHAIYISAIGVALAGLATATGIININDGFLGGRIYSTFQYPNALASYLAAVAFIGFYLWRKAIMYEPVDSAGGVKAKDTLPSFSLNRFNHYLYAAGNFLLLTVFLGTRSNGGFLVFSIIYVLFIIGLPKGNRIPVVIHSVFAGIPAIIAVSQFLSSVAADKTGLAWLWIFAGLALVVAGQALYSISERRGLLQWFAAHKKTVLAVVLLVVFVGCAGTLVYINSHGDTVKNIAEEVRLRNASERFYFFQDAMKMFKERPVIGWGGGGWQEAYRAYQSYLYNSNQVHGHYFQIMVEAGIIGILVTLGIWACFLYAGHLLYHGSKDNTRLLLLTITVAAVQIGLHAVIDFDLSLSALALVLWTMFGLARGIMIFSIPKVEEKKSKSYIPPNYSVLAAVSAASVVIILFAGSLAVANSYAVKSSSYLRGQNININLAVGLLQKASAFNPFNAEYHSYLARVYQQQGKFEEGISEVRAALNISKYSAPCYADLAGLLMSGKKDYAEAVNAAEKALSMAPFQIRWYELLSSVYFMAGYNELAGKNHDMARQYFEKALAVPGLIDHKMAGLNETEKKLWNVAPLMAVTPEISLYVGSSQYLLGQWGEAEKSLKAALQDENSKGTASLWLAVLYKRQGLSQEAQSYLDQAQKLAPEWAKGYESLLGLEVIR